MTLKGLLDIALYYLSVPRCISCDEFLERGEMAFCPKCSSRFKEIANRNCSVCSNVLSSCSCSNDYLESLGVRRVVKTMRYRNRIENLSANKLIYSLKNDDRSDVAECAARLLGESLKIAFDSFDNVVFTNAPRRKKAIIKFGFDHAGRLARRLAKNLGGEYIDIFRSKAKTAQKKMFAGARGENARVVARKRYDLRGKIVIIVDDVITTGSTVGACAIELKQMRPKEIAAAAIAVAYKDKYTPFPKLPY